MNWRRVFELAMLPLLSARLARPGILSGDGMVTTASIHGGSWMSSVIESFGDMNFAKADFGDVRRNRRLVTTADLMRRRPGGSLPQKLNSPKDLRAFYRLMNCDEVTHEAILTPHREAIWKRIAERKTPVLVLHDATELDFTTHLSYPLER